MMQQIDEARRKLATLREIVTNTYALILVLSPSPAAAEVREKVFSMSDVAFEATITNVKTKPGGEVHADVLRALRGRLLQERQP